MTIDNRAELRKRSHGNASPAFAPGHTLRRPDDGAVDRERIMTEFEGRPTSHSYFSQRLRLHYLDWGNAEAPHLLLIHGSQDHCHNWDWTAERLCRSYHVIVPDLRGHGDSEWVRGSPYAMLDYVHDIAQLVEQAGLDSVHVVGHSLGGSIACLYAGIFPERVASLVSIEGVGGVWYTRDDTHPRERLRDWMLHMRKLAGRVPRRYESEQAALERMQTSNPHLSGERARHLTVHGSNRNEDGSYSWKFDNYTHSAPALGMSLADLHALWASIDCPTLLLNARQGFPNRTGQDGSLGHFRRGREVIVDDAGHWLHHDQFEHYMEIVGGFLSEHAGTE